MSFQLNLIYTLGKLFIQTWRLEHLFLEQFKALPCLMSFCYNQTQSLASPRKEISTSQYTRFEERYLRVARQWISVMDVIISENKQPSKTHLSFELWSESFGISIFQ